MQQVFGILHLVFLVDVTKSLDMAIDHPEEDHSHYPAVVTNLKPGGQAELAGVKVGMHIHSINGCSCKDQEMQFVLDLIKECRAAKLFQLFFDTFI